MSLYKLPCGRCKGLGRYPHRLKSSTLVLASISCNSCTGQAEPEQVLNRSTPSTTERDQFYEKRKRGKLQYKR